MSRQPSDLCGKDKYIKKNISLIHYISSSPNMDTSSPWNTSSHIDAVKTIVIYF